jgi:segregation and condensation protein B
MNNNGVREPIIESLILSSSEPLPARKIAEVIDDISPGEIDAIVDDLNIKYTNSDLSFRIRKIAGGYQTYIIEDYARYVEDLFARRRNIRLTRAALETMAIIAYRQPVTRTDIELIRGVASDSVIHTLLERKLITMAGRAETIGRPLLYKTTGEFLKFFNLNSLEDLPKMEEIEELLAAGEPKIPQPSLPFESDDDMQPAPDEISAPDNQEFDQSRVIPMGPFTRLVPDADKGLSPLLEAVGIDSLKEKAVTVLPENKGEDIEAENADADEEEEYALQAEQSENG